MLATHPLMVLSALLLLLAAPAQADSTDPVAHAEAEDLAATTLTGNLTRVPGVTWDLSLAPDATGDLSLNADSAGDLRMTTDSGDTSCQLVDYSLSKPTAITPDPDRCFIPYVLGKIPI